MTDEPRPPTTADVVEELGTRGGSCTETVLALALKAKLGVRTSPLKPFYDALDRAVAEGKVSLSWDGVLTLPAPASGQSDPFASA